MNVDWLTSPTGQAVIEAAGAVSADPNDVERLRRQFPDVDTQDVGAAIHQSWLRKRLASRWGIDTDWLLSADGIEQATRPSVARLHARRMLALTGPGAHVVDLTCGLGFDAAAFIESGLEVTCVEADADTAALAGHNLPAATVVHARAQEFELPSACACAFIDPARRDPSAPRSITGATTRVSDPEQWSPPWSFVTSLAASIPVVVKTAPGITDAAIGTGDVAFVSADGDLVEALITVPGTGRREAVLLNGDVEMVVSGGQETQARDLGAYLLAPNPALVRARALTWLAERVHGGLVHPQIAWLTSDDAQACTAVASDAFRPATVLEVLWTGGYDIKALKRQVAAIPHSSLTVMTRGVQLDVEKVRRALVGSTDAKAPELVLAAYRGARESVAVLAHRVQQLLPATGGGLS